MARSFRLTPPRLDAMVERPRLLEPLRQRFDVAVTTIIGGAGFGKSVLLAQAIRDNDVAPRGTDLWLSCDAGEALTTNLLRGLAVAAGLDPDRVPTVHAFLGAIAERWPMGVCVILDDVHLVAEGSAGSRSVIEMVVDAPPGVSFVLASRSPVAGLARLKAQRRVVELREADLAYRADEVAQLDPGISADLGGWPALVSLAASFGVGAARDFVVEELLSSMDPALRRAVAALALIGGADPELAAAANGAPVDVEAVLRLPMVTTDGTHIVPHALWGELLADELGPREVEAIHRLAGTTLLERGDEIRAGSMFIAAGDQEGLRRAIKATCAEGYATASADVLAWWWSTLDPADRDSCEALLLDALVRRSADPYSERTQAALGAAVVAARAAGDVGLEVAALWEFGFVARARGDIDAMLAEIPRVLELESSGEPVAAPLAAIARAMVSDAMGDHITAAKELALIDRRAVPPGWLAPIAFIRMVFAFYDGHLDRIDATAAAFLGCAPDDFPGREFVEPWVRWLHGIVPADWDSLPAPGSSPGSNDTDRLWTGSATGVMFANADLSEQAESAVGVAVEAGRRTMLPHLRAMVAAGRAALCVTRGLEEEARAILQSALGTEPAAFVARERALSSALAIGYVLVPEHRPYWDEHDLGPLHERVRTLARGFVDVRAGRAPRGLDDAAAAAQLPTALPLAWAVELVCAHVAEDAVRAREMMERLVEAHGERTRLVLRKAAESATSRVARGAVRLLAAVPVGSVEVRVGVLGPAELVVGGRPVDGPDWRRSRVRALLCLLAQRRQVRREDAMSALWPELADKPARHNLRVTLNYLQGLLEPERRAGEAPFYLRQDAEWLRLLDEPHVVVDADVFERGIDRGDRLRTEGRLVPALAAYDDAFTRWRGGYLLDVASEDWAQPGIASLANRAANARLASGSIRMALDDVAGAVDAAIGALAIDPWSEPAYRLTVAAHLARADRAAAHRAMQECRAMLDDLGVTPSAETRALERRLAGPAR